MTRRPEFVLCWAAAPAVALSIWLLHVADAPRSALTLQVGAAGVGMAVFVVLIRMRGVSRSVDTQWLALALTSSLFIPLVGGSEGGAERWVVLGSVRVFVAPVVLPTALLLLGAPLRRPAIYATSVTAAAIALLLQPDAAQLSAFALSMLVLLAASRSHLLLRVALLAVLLCCAVVVWRTPDPLAPVRYVEGVFNLAAEVSPFALLAAVVFAALPVMALLWVARAMRSPGALAVATYYASLLALAPLQVTPVPLLGFGAGPILGYFLVAGVISRARVNHAA
jgi:cell division protein FtsW (lipid II flippase)